MQDHVIDRMLRVGVCNLCQELAGICRLAHGEERLF